MSRNEVTAVDRYFELEGLIAQARKDKDTRYEEVLLDDMDRLWEVLTKAEIEEIGKRSKQR